MGRNISDFIYIYLGASLVAQMIKNLPAMWKTQVQSLGQEDPLEQEMATHCSILTWEISEEPGGLQPWGDKDSDMTELWRLIYLFIWLHCTGCRTKSANQASIPSPLQWKGGVLSTGSPGKSLY